MQMDKCLISCMQMVINTELTLSKRGVMATPLWYDFFEESDEEWDEWDLGLPRFGQRPRREQRGQGRGRQNQQQAQVGRWIRADWIEGPEAHVLKIDLPGVTKDQVHVSIEEQTLVVSGTKRKDRPDRKKGEKARFYERVGGEFVRQFQLPKDVKVEEINAQMEDGVLAIVIPKIQESEAKRDVRTIDVQYAGGVPASSGGGVSRQDVESTPAPVAAAS